MPGVIMRGIIPELLEQVANKVFFKDHPAQPSVYTEFCNTESMDGAFYDDIPLAGVGRFQLKPEGTPVQFTYVVQGLRRRETYFTFALALRVSREARRDEKWGMIKKFVGDLRNAADDSRERLHHGPLNDGFAGSTYLGRFEGDGNRRSLFNTGHVPLRNTSATQSNRLNPGVALSPDGIKSALNIAKTMQSEEERFITVNWDKLVIHPDEEWTAMEILQTTNVPYSADNTKNVIKGAVSVVKTPYQTDTDAWAIFSSGGDAIRCLRREEYTTQQTMDDLTGDAIYMAMFAENTSIGEWRYAVGSSPP